MNSICLLIVVYRTWTLVLASYSYIYSVATYLDSYISWLKLTSDCTFLPLSHCKTAKTTVVTGECLLACYSLALEVLGAQVSLRTFFLTSHHMFMLLGVVPLMSHDASCDLKMAFSAGSWRSLVDAGPTGASLSGNIKTRLLSVALRSENGLPRLVPSPRKGLLHQPVAVSYSTRSHRVLQREKPHDLYATLRLTPSATQQQVKEAYYALSMQFHPDRNKGSEEAHRKFTEITEAYSILGQYELRKKYDKGLIQQFPGQHHNHKHQ